MKVATGWRQAGVVRRALVLGLSFMLFTIQPTLGGAAIVTHSFAAASVDLATPLADLYDYSTGTEVAWTAQAEFDAGTYVQTNGSAVPGSVVLNVIGPVGVAEPSPAITWWDTDWTNRHCYTVDHTEPGATSVTEYQLRLTFPLESLADDGFVQGDFADLRAIATDGSTSLPLWVDDAAPDTLWVRLDTISAGASADLCIYYGYAPGTATAPGNHTELSVFSYTAPQPVYYAVSDAYAAPGSEINVVTFTDGNEVTRSGGTALNLAAAGDLGTFDAVGTAPGSAFAVLGPIAATAVSDGTGPLIPISFAGTQFVVPITRDVQEFSFFAPFSDATVDLYDGVSLAATLTVPLGTAVTNVTDITAGNTAIIETDVPVLLAYRSDLGGDATAVYPASSGTFAGIRSGEILVGYNTDGTAVVTTASDGATAALAGDRGETDTVSGGGVAGGTIADAYLLSADQPIGAAGHEDGDGNESVTVLPVHELSSTYWAATDSQYIAAACPTDESAPIDLDITPAGATTRTVACSGGPDVGWALDTADLAVAATGTAIASAGGDPFAAYYEDAATDDQVALLGPKQARQYTWPEPVVTATGDEGIYESTGSWESATVDTAPGTEIFGAVRIEGSVPTGTALRIQVATADSGLPAAYVGPDGTAGTYFEISSLPAVVDFGNDGDRLLRVRAQLATSTPATATPQLDLVAVDTHLAALDRSLGGPPPITVTSVLDPATARSYLIRVNTSDAAIAGSTATAVYRGGTNLTNLVVETVRFVNVGLGVDSVQQSITLPTDTPLAFDSGQPHSVVLDHSAVGSGVTELSFAWQLRYGGVGSIYIETDFNVEVTAP